MTKRSEIIHKNILTNKTNVGYFLFTRLSQRNGFELKLLFIDKDIRNGWIESEP